MVNIAKGFNPKAQDMDPIVKQAPSFWLPDPLLGAGQSKHGFQQMPWDKAPIQKKDAWRSDAVVPPTPPEAKGVSNLDMDPAGAADPQKVVDPSEEALNADEDPKNPLAAADHRSAQPNPATPASGASDPMVSVSSAHMDQQIHVARQQGYVQGLKDGMAKTLLELQADRQIEKDLMLQVTQALEGLHKDAFRLFEPMRKLSLHIAEQLVRGELTISGLAVERLVKACLSEVAVVDQTVVVYAHPQDLERVRPLIKESGAALKLMPDTTLLQGSVRVQSNDTVIEDLIQNRLENLAQTLIFESADWLRNGSNLAGLRVETVEPAAQDIPMSRSKFDIVDIEEKTMDPQVDATDHVKPSETEGAPSADQPSEPV